MQRENRGEEKKKGGWLTNRHLMPSKKKEATRQAFFATSLVRVASEITAENSEIDTHNGRQKEKGKKPTKPRMGEEKDGRHNSTGRQVQGERQ